MINSPIERIQYPHTRNGHRRLSTNTPVEWNSCAVDPNNPPIKYWFCYMTDIRITLMTNKLFNPFAHYVFRTLRLLLVYFCCISSSAPLVHSSSLSSDLFVISFPSERSHTDTSYASCLHNSVLHRDTISSSSGIGGRNGSRKIVMF